MSQKEDMETQDLQQRHGQIGEAFAEYSLKEVQPSITEPVKTNLTYTTVFSYPTEIGTLARKQRSVKRGMKPVCFVDLALFIHDPRPICNRST